MEALLAALHALPFDVQVMIMVTLGLHVKKVAVDHGDYVHFFVGGQLVAIVPCSRMRRRGRLCRYTESECIVYWFQRCFGLSGGPRRRRKNAGMHRMSGRRKTRQDFWSILSDPQYSAERYMRGPLMCYDNGCGDMEYLFRADLTLQLVVTHCVSKMTLMCPTQFQVITCYRQDDGGFRIGYPYALHYPPILRCRALWNRLFNLVPHKPLRQLFDNWQKGFTFGTLYLYPCQTLILKELHGIGLYVIVNERTRKARYKGVTYRMPAPQEPVLDLSIFASPFVRPSLSNPKAPRGL